jgi:hypothetical protein
MNRSEVLAIIKAAREKGERPNLRYAPSFEVPHAPRS